MEVMNTFGSFVKANVSMYKGVMDQVMGTAKMATEANMQVARIGIQVAQTGVEMTEEVIQRIFNSIAPPSPPQAS